MRAVGYPFDMPALTGLRGLLALWLVLFHARGALPIDIDGWTPLLARGPLGVDGFFVLSGFVLAHVAYDCLRSDRFAVLPFLQRRLARLYPLHLATLCAYLAVLAAAALIGRAPNDPGRYDLSALPANLLLVHAWGTTDQLTFNYPSWSVSAEWFAYLLFPILAPPLLRTTRPILALIMTAGALLVAAWLAPLAFDGRPLTRLTHDGAILRILPSFLLGIALYRLGRGVTFPPLVVRFGCPTAGLGLLVMLHLGAPDAAVVLAEGVLILLVAERARARTDGWLGAGPLVRLGEWSYALYLVHVPVLAVWSALLPGPGVSGWLLGLVLCLVAAACAHTWIERPGRALVLRLHLPAIRRMTARAGSSR